MLKRVAIAGLLVFAAWPFAACSDDADAEKGTSKTDATVPQADTADADGADTAAGADVATTDGGCTLSEQCPDNDGSACAYPECSAGKCITILLPDNAACDDGDACSSGERCDGGACLHGKAKSCDDGNACTDGVCAGTTGDCKFVDSTAGKQCPFGKPCIPAGTCNAGKCEAGPNVCECEKTADCAPKEDGDACNGTLYCDLSHTDGDGKYSPKCKLNPATVVKCFAGKDTDCRTNTCDPATGTCAPKDHPDGSACDDGKAFTKGEACEAGACKEGTFVAFCKATSDCGKWEDGDVCNGTPYCDAATGKCALNPATVVKCPTVDNTACATVKCSPKTGKCLAVAAPDNTTCTDDNGCTVGDACATGSCVGGTNTCACKSDSDCAAEEDGNACNGTLFCNKATGKCALIPTTKITCPTVDDTACRRNVCAPKTGKCAHTPVNLHQSCDEGDPCRAGDACDKAGKCGGGNNLCQCTEDADCDKYDDGDRCNGVQWCDKTAKPFFRCAAEPDSKITCQTVGDTQCAKNTCDPKVGGGCKLTAVIGEIGKACQDGDPCTVKTVCSAGKCAGQAKSCDDDNPCTEDTCTKTTDCLNLPLAATCNDGDACTIKDACVGGTCAGGGKKDCDDGNPCTADSCDVKLGCAATPTTHACDDGDKCTLSDTCAAGKCVPGKPMGCDDGDACTVAEACAAGVCDKGKAKNCDDGNACTDDSCDPDKGCAHAANTGSCTTGNACLAPGTCAAGACKSGKARLFSLKFAGKPWRRAYGVHELGDGSLAVVGNQRGAAGGDASVFVATLGADGSIKADKVFKHDQVFAHDGAIETRGVVAATGGYLVYGRRRAKGKTADGMAMRVSATGGAVWTHVYGGPGDERFAAAAADGAGHVLAGASKAVGAGAADGWAVGIDAAGKQAWQWHTGSADDDGLHAVSVDSGGALAVGHVKASGKAAPTRALVVRLQAGKPAWQRALTPPGGWSTTATAVIATGTGKSPAWLVAGHRSQGVIERPWVRTIDAAGRVVTARVLSSKDLGIVAAVLARDGGGHFLVGTSTVGAAAAGTGDTNGWLLRLDPLTAPVGEPRVLEAARAEQLNAAIAAADGGVVAVGGDASLDGKTSMSWLLRADRWGHVSCTASAGCVGKTDKDCGAGACTLARCEGAAGCKSTPAPLPCDDGKACTDRDACVAGKCLGGGSPSWSGAFGGGKLERGHGVAVMADGDAVIAGSTLSTGKVSDGLLVRVSATGHKRWETYWGPQLGGVLHGVTARPDGTIAAVGSKSRSGGAQGRDGWLLRVDGAGKLLGQTTLSDTGGVGSLYALASLADGRFALVGDGAASGSAPKNARVGELRLVSALGAEDTARGARVDSAGADVDSLRAVAGFDAGSVVAAGLVGDGKAGPLGVADGWLVRLGTAKKDDVRWQLVVGGKQHDALHAVAVTKDATVVAAGHLGLSVEDSAGWLLGVSGAGKQLWQRKWGTKWRHRIHAIAAVPGGGWALAGTRPFDGLTSQAWLLRLSPALGVEFERTLGKHVAPGAVIGRDDGGLQLVGDVPGANKGDPGDAWTGRTDRWGNLSCHAACRTTLAAATACDDGKPCTMDLCDATTGKCKLTPAFQGQSCADGDPCLASASCDKGVCVGVPHLWEKTFGADNFDRVEAIAISPDQTRVTMAGRTSSKVKGKIGGWLQTVDAGGKSLDNLGYGAGQSATSYAAIRDDKGTYVVGGQNHPSKLKYVGIWGYKPDGGGIGKTIFIGDGIVTGRFRGLTSVAGHHYLVGWAQKSQLAANGGWFVRVDPDKATVVASVVIAEGTKEDRFYAIAALDKDTLIAVGRSQNLAQKSGVAGWLISLDNKGTKRTQAIVETSGYHILHDVAALPSGGVVAVGFAAPSSFGKKKALLVRASAKLKLEATWPLTIADAQLAGVTAVPGGFAVVGTAAGDLLAQRWTTAGQVRWSRTWHLAKEEGTAIARFGDSLILAGITWLKGTSVVNDDVDSLVLRVDLSGNVACSQNCVGAKAITCDDGKACTADYCDGKTGKCAHPALPTGIPCGGG